MAGRSCYPDPEGWSVGPPASAGKRSNREWLTRLDHEFILPRDLLADVGTRIGWNLQERFTASFARAYLVESEPRRFRRLQRAVSAYESIVVINSDARSLTPEVVPFGQADFVMSKYVLQHLPTWEIEPHLDRLLELARPGGWIGLLIATAGDQAPYFMLTLRERYADRCPPGDSPSAATAHGCSWGPHQHAHHPGRVQRAAHQRRRLAVPGDASFRVRRARRPFTSSGGQRPNMFVLAKGKLPNEHLPKKPFQVATSSTMPLHSIGDSPASTMPAPVKLHFMVPGISKCGTTTLCGLLTQHPALFMPTRLIPATLPSKQESMFFSFNDYERAWAAYVALFDAAQPGALVGDGSTFYAASGHEVRARQRILAHYPHVKLIFIVRDPIARIEASFRELHHSGPHYGEDCPFELDAAFARFPSFIEDTRYWERLANYRDHVDDDQVLVIFAEELFANQQSVIARCFEFLGVEAKVELPKLGVHLNRGTDKLYDTKALREMRSLLLHPETADALARVRPETQDQFLVKLGLRKRFDGGSLYWSEAARAQVVEALRDDTARFLEFYGKPFDFWPRFAAACAGDRSSLEGERIP